MKLDCRIIIYAQDIMKFTGRSRSYAYKSLNQVKTYFGKSKGSLVTFQEFADFHGIRVEEIENILFENTPNKKDHL
ncbi:hypothetical protein SAMN04488104_103036 [Algoriphagus faecimaris]|uniref:Uncharacterized protein n=1 Tax=Algoriphagus faecimaris TaxID=686796 RepID=A0A1G6UTV2_9BACT|nr:hypothetical protein [Algoriphagus faecimaris]SDD44798.1 hypothetical protein SAMN04488104_103036 [Algoriphagus faecimaris]